ncbi:hypothetical protein [Pseudoduganella namucuonensis]|uniref:DUF4398 domain-containing protein n=1 Tax=Pseudoduganella namucuonensis TaxID=1035707 RepID=A0A1I7GS32_9BURK|nr:hypothetical protein [Pseudoduganella namucuonensis]SFU51258.1 hypothetical protein SAMN05216552_100464 [Pseudoduganella namucuonensis]
MNVLKNFEALFVVTLGLACAANYVVDTDAALDSQPTAVRAAAPAYAAAAKDMQVVVVSAKRLTAEEKAQSLLAERKAASASIAANGASKI